MHSSLNLRDWKRGLSSPGSLATKMYRGDSDVTVGYITLNSKEPESEWKTIILD